MKADRDPQFQSVGNTQVNESEDTFISLIPSMLNLLSEGDSLIANLIIKEGIDLTIPSFFQLPYIVSIIDNVNKNNYTFSSSTNGDLVTSIYKIPYQGLIGEDTVTFITFYDKSKKILTYQIPRELSYNSFDQANVIAESINEITFKCYLIIPQSFYLSGSNLGYEVLNFTINISLASEINDNSRVRPDRPGYYVAFWLVGVALP